MALPSIHHAAAQVLLGFSITWEAHGEDDDDEERIVNVDRQSAAGSRRCLLSLNRIIAGPSDLISRWRRVKIDATDASSPGAQLRVPSPLNQMQTLVNARLIFIYRFGQLFARSTQQQQSKLKMLLDAAACTELYINLLIHLERDSETQSQRFDVLAVCWIQSCGFF